MDSLGISPAFEGLKVQDVEHREEPDEELLLSAEETKILSLYDQVQKLELEIALTRARIQLTDGKPMMDNQDDEDDDSSIDDSEEEDTAFTQELKEAMEKFVNAKAPYTLRNAAVNSVLITNPILKATHDSRYSSPIEENILQWIKKRDTVSVAVAKQSTELREVLDQLVDIQVETQRACVKNQELARQVLGLVKEVDQGKADAITDPAAREEIKKLEQKLKASRQKWKIIKGTASGVVAGSGVDWARDPELRDVVLDPE